MTKTPLRRGFLCAKRHDEMRGRAMLATAGYAMWRGVVVDRAVAVAGMARSYESRVDAA